MLNSNHPQSWRWGGKVDKIMKYKIMKMVKTDHESKAFPPRLRVKPALPSDVV